MTTEESLVEDLELDLLELRAEVAEAHVRLLKLRERLRLPSGLPSRQSLQGLRGCSWRAAMRKKVTAGQEAAIWRFHRSAYPRARIAEKLFLSERQVARAIRRLEAPKAPKENIEVAEERETHHHETPSGKPDRPCNRCNRTFTPTLTRTILCVDCFRGRGNSYSWGDITGERIIHRIT